MSKYVAVFLVVVGLLAGSFGTAAAQDPTAETAGEATATEEATGTPTEEATTEPTEEATAEPTEEATAEPTTEATEEASADEADSRIAPMAINPETGEIVAIDWVSFGVPEGATVSDLATLSVTLSDVSEDACQLGSPRFAIRLGDAGYVAAYVADAPGFASCSGNAAINGENLVTLGENRFDMSFAGGSSQYVTFAEVVAQFGDAPVTGIDFIVEYGSVTPAGFGVAFDVTTPSQALGSITVNKTFVGPATITDDACFTLTSGGTQVGEPACIAPADVAGDGTASVAFERLRPGDYTVTETTVPTGYTGSDPVTITVREGYDEVVSFTNASQAADVTIDIESADPEIASAMPEGATWSVSSGGVVVDSDTFASDDLALPAQVVVENPVPYGTYSISVDAGPTFAVYTADVTVDAPAETVTIELQPTGLSPELAAIVAAIVAAILSALGLS